MGILVRYFEEKGYALGGEIAAVIPPGDPVRLAKTVAVGSTAGDGRHTNSAAECVAAGADPRGHWWASGLLFKPCGGRRIVPSLGRRPKT